MPKASGEFSFGFAGGTVTVVYKDVEPDQIKVLASTAISKVLEALARGKKQLPPETPLEEP